MNSEERFSIGDIKIMINGEVIGNAESISYEVNENEVGKCNSNINFTKSFEGTLEVESFNEELFEALGLSAWQKAIMRRELRKQQLEQSKEKKLGIRESMNKHFKRGKKW